MTKLTTLVPILAILTGLSMSPAYGHVPFPAASSVQHSLVIDPSLASGSVLSHHASVPAIAITTNNVHTFYLGSSTVDSCTGKCENLSTSTGTADTTTSQLLAKTVGKYQIQPDVALTTTTGTPSISSVSGYAWVYNTDLGGSTIQSGTWTFDLTLTASTTSGAPLGSVWITVWNCNTNGLGSCTFLFKNWDNSTTAWSTTPTKYTFVTGTIGPFSNVHFIAVEYWISYTLPGASNILTVTETTVSPASDVITPGWSYARSFSASLALAASLFATGTAPAPDFAISAAPASLTLKDKASGTSTITLTSLNGFTGKVNLSDTVIPVVKKGPTPSLSIVSVTLTTNGQATSTLTVSAEGPTPPGTYTVTVTGVSGTLTHQVQVIVTVTTG